jgi:hypothetical protein
MHPPIAGLINELNDRRLFIQRRHGHHHVGDVIQRELYLGSPIPAE